MTTSVPQPPLHSGADGITDSFFRSDARAKVLAWSIGLIPVVMALTTWNEDLSSIQRLSRFFFVPVLGLELSIVILWICNGAEILRPPNHIIGCLAALIAIAWTGAIISASDYSIIQTLIWTMHLLFGLAMASLARQEPKLATHLVTAMLAGFVLFAALFVLFVALRYRDNYNWVNDIPAYANVRWFAFYAEAIFGLCAWGWLQGRKADLAVASLALALALWTGSRASLAAVTGGYLVACIVFPFMRRGWQRFLIAIAGGIILAAAAAWLVPLGVQGPQRLIYDTSDSGRLEVWLVAVHAISGSPWFGWGDGRFAVLSLPYEFNHPHNVILQILLAWGFVGALMIAVLAHWVGNRIRRAAVTQDAPFLLATLMLSAASLVDGTLYFVHSTFLFILCLAMLTALPANRATRSPSPTLK